MLEALASEITSPESVRVAGAMTATFVAVFVFVLGVNAYVRSKRAVQRRLVTTGAGTTGAAFDRVGGRGADVFSTSALLDEVRRSGPANESEASKLRRELFRAGFFRSQSVYWYQLTRMIFLIVGVFSGFFAHNYLSESASVSSSLLVGACLGCVAFLLPNRFLVMRQNRVVRECREGFPDLLDLMIICAEAGLGPRAAIDQLSKEISNTYPILGAHCYLASLEIRAGASLHDALFNLSQRIQVEEAAMLASLLEQTEQLGTSVSDALRVYSSEMRERRLVRAEEKAHSLPAKLVLPLTLFVFPVLLVVILLPALMKIRNVFPQ